MKKIYLLFLNCFLFLCLFAQVPVPMASQPGLTFTEDFSDIANWTNDFATGTGANHFKSVPVNATGTIPDGVRITTSTATFSSGTSGGVQRGTQAIVLLSTGSTDKTSSVAIDFLMDFSGVDAGTLSFDWAAINNSTGDRKGSLQVYYSTDGTTFTELPAAQVLDFANNPATAQSGSITNVQLPTAFNNSPTARLRFYYYNGTGGSTGSRPKISIDNLTVTAVANGTGDVNPPSVIVVSPVENATNVLASSTAVITFNENVQLGTSGTIRIKKVADNTDAQVIDITTPGAVTVASNTASFALALQTNTAYYVTISAGAFKDIAGNNFTGITDPTRWSFTTSSVLNTIYSANFNTCAGGALADGFTQYSVTGSQVWDCTTFGNNSSNGVQINGFTTTNVPNEDWLISPALNLTGSTYPLLSFWSINTFNGAPLQLKVSTNYAGSGDPRLATWTDLNGRFPAVASNVWTQSSNINLSAYKQAGVYIAFVYVSTDEEGARWTVDDIKVDNSITPPPAMLTVSTSDMQFGYVAAGGTANKTFVLNANDITTGVTVTASAGFLVSKDGSSFSSSITYTQAEANNIPKTVYVQFAPTLNDKNSNGTVTATTSSLTTTVSVKGTSIDPIKTLEVVNWNVEWFGSTVNGPTNDAQQEANIKTILQNIGADVYGLLEVVDESRLANIVSQIPGYSYVISNFGSHTNPNESGPSPLSEAQKLAFVYKTSVLSNVTTMPLLSVGINTVADLTNPNYDYWSSGRFPFMMSADVTLNGVTKNMKFVLVHAKANTSPTATSYTRRQNGANALHTLLNTSYATDNIIILGDFNDDLDQSITAGQTITSWNSFTTDATNFSPLTLALSQAGKKSTVSYNDVIDHVIVSNELRPYYLNSTVNVLTDVSSLVSSYGSTTTDHYPVFSRFAFDAGILPLRLLEFTGTKQSGSVVLNWKTADEVNTKQFVVERSVDGQNFEAIGTVSAAGNGSLSTYQFIDAQPAAGSNYYRLRMVDDDGKFSLSGVIKVSFDQAYVLTLLPNPAKGSFTVTTTASEPLTLHIIDMNGKVVKTQILTGTVNKVGVSQLTKGIYMVRITSAHGIQNKKLVIE